MTSGIRSIKKQDSYERILDAAARAVRSNGFAGVGVADVMREAGLTHGGFYAHFKSRDALLAKALEHAGRGSAESISRRIDAQKEKGGSPFRALVERYLSDWHLAFPEAGCAVAALSSEMPRQCDDVREAARDRVRSLVAMVRDALPPGTDDAAALTVASTMVGALQLARTLGNNAQGKALLAANRNALLRQYGGTDAAL
ncbi:TetR/AcrR family transcriptional regulator [Noviherbaspirillum sp.]|uniref:TetR/AcrR family transcriptional regulator n=1 Tax=Noviherbaspirillum sp. TaxID=1926288 RepID=UPI002D58379D|nr:TetR/AcrR family transcriptional regulator [Noviherbaspirillum sp.]HZW21810.1 TetR/AcrR family transcriptional regulator [Noviherbaspirillum sp.]